ncbi:MAG: putative metal-binding motif-containing protein [Myxococcota bacterium]
MRPLLCLVFLPGCFVTDAELERALDRDQDGFQPAVAGGPDCDAENAAVNPDAPELCGDGIDNDCDGRVDDRGVGEREWFADADNDGWGAGDAVLACNPPEGHVAQTGDCDDGDAEISPNALDLCDGADQDCDGVIDDDATFRTVFRDADGDGVGTSTETDLVCGSPSGWADIAGDCDDSDASRQPGIVDFCDGIDQDCDGAIDEDAAFATYYEDSDADGFGTVDHIATTCDGPPPAYVETAGDCDDLDPTVILPSWFLDADGDGHGAGAPVQACVPPAQHVADSDDCDDTNPFRSPSEVEVCENGVDDDCFSDTDCRNRGSLGLDQAIQTFADPTVFIEVIPNFIGESGPNVVVLTNGEARIFEASAFMVGGPPATTLVAPAADALDIDGDGRSELLAVHETHLDVYAADADGAVSVQSSITSIPPTNVVSTHQRAAFCDIPSFGPGFWIGLPGTSSADGGGVVFVPYAAGSQPMSSATHSIVGSDGSRLGTGVWCVSEGLFVHGATTSFYFSGDDLLANSNTGLPASAWSFSSAERVLDLAPTPSGIGTSDRLAQIALDEASQFPRLVTSLTDDFSSPPILTFSNDDPFTVYYLLGDHDGDGLLDAAGWNLGSRLLRIAYGGPPGGDQQGTLFGVSTSQVPLEIVDYTGGDVDEDGYADILIATRDQSSSRVFVLYGTGQ